MFLSSFICTGLIKILAGKDLQQLVRNVFGREAVMDTPAFSHRRTFCSYDHLSLLGGLKNGGGEIWLLGFASVGHSPCEYAIKAFSLAGLLFKSPHDTVDGLL